MKLCIDIGHIQMHKFLGNSMHDMVRAPNSVGVLIPWIFIGRWFSVSNVDAFLIC